MHGLCGTYDDDISNEYTSAGGIVMNLKAFAESYGAESNVNPPLANQGFNPCTSMVTRMMQFSGQSRL